MKKSLVSKIWALVALMTLSLTACEEPVEEITPNFPEKVTATVMAGQEYEFTIEPNMKWTLKIPTEVATFFKFIVGESERYTLNGEAGTHTITIGVAANEEFDTTRTCAVEMTMGGESQVVLELTRGSKERKIAIYAAEYDTQEDTFATDEEDNYIYSSTPSQSLEWVWSNEQWMQRIVVESNFRWNLGADTPEWINASKTSGSAGRTEIFLRTNKEYLPLEETTCTVEFCDMSDRNDDGVIDDSDILVVASMSTTIEGCKDICEVSLSGDALFNAEGEYFTTSSDSYVDLVYGRINSPRGAEIFAVNKSADGSYTKEGAEWILFTVEEYPTEAGEVGIWTREFSLDVEANTSEEPRYGAIVAIPLSEAGATNYADFVVCEITQEGVEVIDTSDPIYVYDESAMMGFGARFEKLTKGSWPWTNNWAGIPHAYKLTLRNNDSGDDLVFRRPFSSYKIYGYAGYTGATYDIESCWLTINESAEEENIENGYIIKSRLDEELYPNTLPGSKGQNEATFIFNNEKGEAYALVYVVLDPDFSPYSGTDGDVKFADAESANLSGAKLEEIVDGDDEYSEEDDYMGILQYRLTLTPDCKSVALIIPEYSMHFAYQGWLEAELQGDQTIITSSSETSATGRISFYGSNNYNVILQLTVVYKAE